MWWVFNILSTWGDIRHSSTNIIFWTRDGIFLHMSARVQDMVPGGDLGQAEEMLIHCLFILRENRNIFKANLNKVLLEKHFSWNLRRPVKKGRKKGKGETEKKKKPTAVASEMYKHECPRCALRPEATAKHFWWLMTSGVPSQSTSTFTALAALPPHCDPSTLKMTLASTLKRNHESCGRNAYKFWTPHLQSFPHPHLCLPLSLNRKKRSSPSGTHFLSTLGATCLRYDQIIWLFLSLLPQPCSQC